MFTLRPNLKLLTCLVLLCCAVVRVQALPSDREQPVNIEADTAELSQEAGQTIYRGHVKLTQGSLKIFADEIIISVTEGILRNLVASGQQASLSQLVTADKPEITATADVIHYNIAADSLLLEGTANIVHGDSQFAGNRIEYLIKAEKVQAEERVRMTIPTTHTAGSAE